MSSRFPLPWLTRGAAPWLLPVMLLPLVTAGVACDRGEAPEVLLAEASTEVTFASVEQLGPHHFLSSVSRTDSRDGVPDLVVDEIVEISWQDWDYFHVRRLVDGDAERETIVFDGRPWVRSADRWERRDDAEPHRLQLRTTWNAWDAVLGTHLEHFRLVPDGDDIVEGRPASRFKIEMLPPDLAPKARSWGFRPESISGTVWLDKGTAVRLKAEIDAVSRRQGLTRTVRFKLQRANIGEDQGVREPSG